MRRHEQTARAAEAVRASVEAAERREAIERTAHVPREKAAVALLIEDGWSTRAVAALYRVHPSTVRRWLSCV